MTQTLSVIMITKNASELLERSIQSVKDLADEVVIVDDNSTDNTKEIAKRYDARVYNHHEENLGKQKQYALDKATGDWVLVLDADELVGSVLSKEIKSILKKEKNPYTGYIVGYQNYFLGKMIHMGGENYRMLRLFKREKGLLLPALVHENVTVEDGKIGQLQGHIHHYSYRSISQMLIKFTDYAKRDAKEKWNTGERVTIKKLFFYGPHMFWARFVKSKGYKDGVFRIPLDLGFAYMEGMTYVYLLWYTLFGIPKQVRDDRRIK